MARAGKLAGIIAAICVFIPLWTSVLVRSYAWIVLLQRNGIVNGFLSAVGLTEQPFKLLYTQGAVTLAMAHVLMPFVVLPIYAALKAIPKDLDRAALNLGANPGRLSSSSHFLCVFRDLCRSYPMLCFGARLLHNARSGWRAGFHVDGNADRSGNYCDSGLAIRCCSFNCVAWHDNYLCRVLPTSTSAQ